MLRRAQHDTFFIVYARNNCHAEERSIFFALHSGSAYPRRSFAIAQDDKYPFLIKQKKKPENFSVFGLFYPFALSIWLIQINQFKLLIFQSRSIPDLV